MPWSSGSVIIGFPQPGYVDNGITVAGNLVPQVALGSISGFRDPVLGYGEFIYLPGTAGTLAGDVVNYTTSDGATNTGSTTRWAGTSNSGVPLAVAAAAIGAGQWGWYQITGGAATNISGTVTAGQPLYWQATATVSSTGAPSKQMIGAVATSASGVPAAGKAIVYLERPNAQGAIT